MHPLRPSAVARRLRSLRGERAPIGYVFMVGRRPRGPLRRTEDEALRDAVLAGEAAVCPQHGRIFLEPLTWIAPIWP